MNYIFICHDLPELPRRFYPHNVAVNEFRFDVELSNAGKWKNIYAMLLRSGPYAEGSFFWFPDPDLEFTADLPAKLFTEMRERGLDLAQPSVTADSICHWKELFHREHGDVSRLVPHCEIMMPCFSLAALRRNLWTFDLNYSGFGIDLLWGKREECYVLDWLQVRHPSSPDYTNTARKHGFPDPNRELAEIKRLYL